MNMTIIDEVRARLATKGQESGIDEVAAMRPRLTWNQVFLAVEFLSRTGQIQLRLDPSRGYRVALLPAHQSMHDPISIVA